MITMGLVACKERYQRACSLHTHKKVKQANNLMLVTYQFSSAQSLSHVRLFVTPWTAASQASLSITNSWSPPEPMSIKSVKPSNHLILCHPLLLLPSIFPSIRVFSNESALCIRCPKYWSFSFNISPSNEHPGLISFRMDWVDLLAVQGTLKSLLQYHSSKASILLHSAFFIVQLSHPYMTTGKTYRPREKPLEENLHYSTLISDFPAFRTVITQISVVENTHLWHFYGVPSRLVWHLTPDMIIQLLIWHSYL